MATSLERQLAALAAPSTSILVVERKRSSILFSSKEAAGYDRETFYQIGIEGLRELNEINPRLFGEYFDSMIFDEASKLLERAVMDRETNKLLDDVIDGFLVSISPYMTIKAPLKCLEWLVYRFHIEKFNVHSILKCILPYYDTKAFALVVKVLEVDQFQSNQNWSWLLPCIKLGIPLTRKDLFDNVNVAFISWLFDTLQSFLRIHEQNLESVSTFIAFLTSVSVGVLHLCNEDRKGKAQKTKIIMKILWKKTGKLLMKLKDRRVNANDNVRSLIFTILTMLTMVHKEHPEIVISAPGSTVMRLLLETSPPHSMQHAILLVNFMATYSHWEGLTLQDDEMKQDVAETVSRISVELDLSAIVELLLISHASPDNVNVEELWSWIDNFAVSVETRAKLLRDVYYKLRPMKKSGKLRKAPIAAEFAARFERQFPVEFSLICKKDQKFVQDLLDSEFGQVTDAAVNAEATIRCEAIAKSYKLAEKRISRSKADDSSVKAENVFLPDTNAVARGIIHSFDDDDPSVLAALLQPKTKLMKCIFSVETLVNGLCKILVKNVSYTCSKLALRRLCGLVGDDLDEGLKKKVLATIYQFLFPRSTTDAQLTLQLLKSPLIMADKAFHELKQRTATIEAELTHKQLCQFGFEILTSSKDLGLPVAHWINQYELHKQGVYAVFASLFVKNRESAILLLNLAEKEKAKIVSSKYPVTSKNFLKVLKACEADKVIPLELVLTALEKINFNGDKSTLRRIFSCAIYWAEDVNSKEAVSKFLHKLLKINFARSSDLLQFWRYMMLNPPAETSNKTAEFFSVRVLQFLHAIFAKLSKISVVETGLPSVSEVDTDDEVGEMPTFTPRKSLRSGSEVRDVESAPRRSLRSNSQQRTVAPLTLENLSTASPLKRSRRISGSESISSKTSRADVDINQYKDEATQLFLALLTQCIRNDSSYVRHWGFECLKILLDWEHLETAWADLIKFLLDNKSEVESDPKQLNKTVARMLSGKGHARLQKRLTDVIKDAQELDIIRIGLLDMMANTDNASIFEGFLRLIREELKKESTSKMLLKLVNTFDGSIKHLDVLKSCLDRPATSKSVLSKWNTLAFDKLTPQSQKILFVMLIDVSGKCETSEVKVAIQRTVRRWLMSSEVISSELEVCVQLFVKQTQTASGTRAVSKIGTYVRDDSITWAARTEAVLEFAQNGKRLTNKTKLIPVLCKLLKICIALEEQSPVEYLKQLILTSLTIACEHETTDDFKQHMNDWVNFQVDIVIDCLRCSRNPQTHHHALILLNYASKLFPEQVLHGVMSLFTFMGNSILRQDDAYSTQLIQQTVTTIIPTLAVSGSVQSYSKSRISAGIYRVFTSAVEDIPTHRRVPIFTSLVKVLGPEESMWQVCLIIIDNALSSTNKRVAVKADMELAESVVWSFEPECILGTLESLYAFISNLPVYDKKRNEDFSKVQTAQNSSSKAIIDLARKNNLKEVQLVLNFLLELAGKIVMKFNAVETKSLNFDTLLQKCLEFSKLLAPLHDDKTYRTIASRNFEVLEKLNDILSATEFIRSLQFILTGHDTNVKKKALDMLNQRLLQRLEWFEDLEALLILLPVLLSCLKQQIENEEAVQYVQTIFLTLKLFARHLASKNLDSFVPVFEISFEHARSKNVLLSASALLCISELFCLKALIIPKLAEITDAILRSFKHLSKLHNADDVSTEDDGEKVVTEPKLEEMQSTTQILASNLLLLSGMTTFIKFIEQLGMFAGSGFLTKALVSLLSIKSEVFGDGEKADNRKKNFETKLKIITKVISSKISLRALLMPLRKAFIKLTSKHDSSVTILMKLLKESLTNTDKQEHTTLMPSIQDSFIIEFLEFRRMKVEDPLTTNGPTPVHVVEDDIIDCLVSGVILKLSEASFRPFYHRLYDWAGDNTSRMITFYRLSSKSAEKLKSLFVSFAGYVIDGAAKCLGTDEDLTKAVLKYLYQIFRNDREGFVTPERFNALLPPILDLIESENVISGDLPIAEVNATVIQMAMATNDLNRWQHLIELIGLKAQHENRQVRLFTVLMLESVAKELEKDFLPLLPPAVPFLAELLGDDDEEVEAATKKMLVQLEAIVGEPLQPYFSS